MYGYTHAHTCMCTGMGGMKKVMSSLDFLTKRNDSGMDLGRMVPQVCLYVSMMPQVCLYQPQVCLY